MATEFRLILEGDIPLRHVADIAAPEAREVVEPGYRPRLSADLYEQLGYAITIVSGNNGYYDAESGNSDLWVWEPESYAKITFYIGAGDIGDLGVPNMFAAVARVLEARPEDAALIQNSNWLLLTRVNGTIRNHNLDLWYDDALNLIPG